MPRRKKQFKTITGMADILPKEQLTWQKIEKVVTAMANFYDFSKISTPILEEEELFIKGTGQTTDIVQKQMYSFRTKGGERVVLRPEFTPALIRAYIEKGMESLPKPVKLWSWGPVFRHERPQKGRYRQFHHFDFEIIGDESPVVDVLLIQLCCSILDGLNLSGWKLEINSIGCKDCRSYYRRKLKSYYRGKIKQICPNCRKRLEKNPLRLLDCKEEKCQRVRKFAPQIVNLLCESCHKHFHSVLEFLDAAEIPYVLNPYLVRGLDYYEKTVFEIIPEGKETARQSALIGGGRYDKLIEELGGKSTPAVGAAGGIERIIEEIKEKKVNINLKSRNFEIFEKSPKIFLVQLGELAKKKSLVLIEKFEKAGLKIGQNLGKDNLRSQLQLASKTNAKYSLILGQKEVLEEKIILRNMETGIQEIFPLKEIIKEIKKKLR